MSRDLTDHVRERDEAEGEHKPITDAEAKEILGKVDAFRAKSDILRLLYDRDVAMEIIDELLLNYKADTLDYQQPFCVHCDSQWDDEFLTHKYRTDEHHTGDCIITKARALLAAVRGE